MKPARFSYLAPDSLGEALGVLEEHGDAARVLAGGQSLGPLLNLRLALPEVLVDANRIPGLDSLTIGSRGAVEIGAMARQHAVERREAVISGWPMVAEAIAEIGHRAIRNRGTVGGSVAHADPAAELPAAFVALDVEFAIASSGGTRSVPASEFFVGPFTTVLEPGEMLAGITVPPVRERTGQAWLEYSRRHGDFGVVGVAALLSADEDGRCSHARLVYSGVASVPWEPQRAIEMLAGSKLSPELITEAGRAAAEESAPPGDIHASAAHRRRLIRALTPRALDFAALRWRRGRRDGDRRRRDGRQRNRRERVRGHHDIERVGMSGTSRATLRTAHYSIGGRSVAPALRCPAAS